MKTYLLSLFFFTNKRKEGNSYLLSLFFLFFSKKVISRIFCDRQHIENIFTKPCQVDKYFNPTWNKLKGDV